ncbi:MAG TPA: Os1348 family NHLP clan protein [Ktedonosporobacter sp.]|nr:Os1348 family NHLP clan protein [Ktedonosporobacter sp.]
MSLADIHKLIGLATIDPEFCQELLEDPLAAIQTQGFDLTSAEQEALSTITAHDLSEFSRIVLDRLDSPQEEQE